MSTASTPRRRRWWVWPAVLAIVLAMGGLFVYYGWLRPKWMAEAEAANRRGIAHLERYEYELAQKDFEEALRLEPRWSAAKINLGISLFNQQPDDRTKPRSTQIERAEAIFNEVLAKDPENKQAHYCLGVIEQYFGDFAKAYEHYVVVSRLDPEDPHTWLRVGTCHPNGAYSPDARACCEKALKLDPYLYEARYRWSQILLHDDPDRGKEESKLTDKLRESEWTTESKLERYGDQGKYALAVGGEEPGKPPVGQLPLFEVPSGFDVTLAPGARWATTADLDPLRKAARDRFGATVVLFDYNRDGRPDLFLTSAVVQDGKVRDVLLRNEGNFKFTDVTAAVGLAVPRQSLGAAAADYDNDGFVDLVVTGAGEQHLFRNKGDGTFDDLSAAAGLDKIKGVCLGCAWADLDQDCDLDLVLCRYADSPEAAAGFAADHPKGGGVILLENVGEAKPAVETDWPPLTTKFKENGVLATATGPCATISAVIADLDGDRDPDLLILADGADPILIENDRLLRFHRATPQWLAGHPHRWSGGLTFVATQSDRPDLLLLRSDGPPIFLVAKGKSGYAVGTTDSPALRQAVALDLDLDGWPDAVGLAGGSPTLLHNVGDARLENSPGAFGQGNALPTGAWAMVAADMDGDGNPELLIWSDAGVALRKNAGNGNKAFVVDLTGLKDASKFMRSNRPAVGARLTAETERHWTAAERTTQSAGLGQSFLPLTLGMGKNDRADIVHVRWPDGVNQAELAMEVKARVQIQENSRKSTSCPVLFVWNGERFVFVTDFLGAGSMGELAADGSTRPPRPEESVKIEPGTPKVKDGHYVLKIAEPMDEVCYLDHLRLDVVDHPAGVAVFPDERFATNDPQPTQELFAFRDRRFPKKATDHRGNDVTTLVLERDRRAPDNFHLRSWLGFAEDHSLTLDFGDVPAGKNWHLVMAGWTEYPYPESIYAAERAGVPLVFPVLERLAADGKTWEPLGDLGFPAGLPRVMTRPLPDLKSGPCTLRIRTNMQVYFDQVYLATAEDVGLKVHSLEVARADLAARGFIQEILPDGRPPIAYDDAKTESVPITKWKGKITRTGDVTELLTAADDRFVTFGPGDEITVRFDASKLPPVPAGWERSFVLRSRGYSKDTAPFTALGGNVEPLPFRAMKNYPDFGGAKPPATDAAKWNTRPVGGR